MAGPTLSRRQLVHWLAAGSAWGEPAFARAATPPPPPTFGDTLGLGVKFLQGQPLTTLPMLEDLGVHWVREHIPWRAVEPSPGRYVGFPANLQRQLAYYKEQGIGLVALLTLANDVYAVPGQPASNFNPEAFGRFALYAAQELSKLGIPFVLEVGNEPHNSALPKLLGGQWNGHPPSPWVGHYVAMVNAAVAQVKAWNPAVKLLAQDDMWVLHYRFLEAGLDKRLDGLSVHPYTGTPEVAAVAADTDWVRPFTAVDPDRSFASAVRRLREAARAKWGRSPEIWVTEWGWATAEGLSPVKNGVPEHTVASYLPRAFVLAAEAGVTATLWFSSQDAVDGPMGLTTNNRIRREAYQAYRTLSRVLGPATHWQRLLGAQGIHAEGTVFRFDRPDGQVVLVAWQARTGLAQSLSLPHAHEARVLSLLGDEQASESGAQGMDIPLTAAPVYVQLASASPLEGMRLLNHKATP